MSEEIKERIISALDSIQSSVCDLCTLVKPMNENQSNISFVNDIQAIISNQNISITNISKLYKEYTEQIVHASSKLVNLLENESQCTSEQVMNIKDKINEFKISTEVYSQTIDNFLHNFHTEPRFCFKSDRSHSYKFDVELMNKYPDSYFMNVYNSPRMWMDSGDINIEHNGENYEYILKYMNNDEQLLEDLKNMKSKKRYEFIDDLDFLKLPVKVDFINELCFDDDNLKIEAWKKNRVIMVNGYNAIHLNKYLKNKNMFDFVFNKNNIENVKYFKKTNIIYVNLKLQYGDFIEDFCKNGVMNGDLLEMLNLDYTDVINEMKSLGIEVNENQMFNAWKKHRYIYVNNEYKESIDRWIKQYELFKRMFYDKNNIQYIERQWSSSSARIYINVQLKYVDFINDYCKNDIMNGDLLTQINLKYEDVIDEMKSIGIEVNENQMIAAWKKNRYIYINNQYISGIDIWIKQFGPFKKEFYDINNKQIKDYNRKKNTSIIYINKDLKYVDFIDYYCRNSTLNGDLLVIFNLRYEDVINEMKKLEINVNENQMFPVWAQNRYIYVNNKYNENIDKYVKRLPSFKDLFYNEYYKQNVGSYKNNKYTSIYINLKLNYAAFIEEYCKNDAMNGDLLIISYLKYESVIDEMNFLGIDVNENQIFDAWRKNRYIYVNNKFRIGIDNWIKRSELFINLFYDINNEQIIDIGKNGINSHIYVNIKLRYVDFIEEYCNTNMMNGNLLKGTTNGSCIDDLIYELKFMNININEYQKKQIDIFFDPRLLPGSKILLNQEYDQILQTWLDIQCRWKLIFRASEHHFRAKSFHKYCDNIQQTLILIKSENEFIFGGYTTKLWNDCDYHFRDDSNAFIFTLKNPYKFKPAKYGKRKESDSAIRCDNSLGPTFCGNDARDICITDNCDRSNSCWIQNDGNSGYYCHPTYGKSLFVKTSKEDEVNRFSVSEYEVYTIDN